MGIEISQILVNCLKVVKFLGHNIDYNNYYK